MAARILKIITRLVVLVIIGSMTTACAASPDREPLIQRVSTVPPFPRGLAIVDDDLYVLCRGRVRSAGGVTATIDDEAGSIYVIDPTLAEDLKAGPVGPAVRTNGHLFVAPSDPPLHLWDRTASPPESDTRTDRPYCTLRYHDASDSFYICAFSGVDLPRTAADPIAFSKNRTDAILRLDRRTRTWSVIDRHRADSSTYPHSHPITTPPPHGWVNGPDNCLPIGDQLYVVAKDNSRVVRYDLSDVRPGTASIPRGWPVLGERIPTSAGEVTMRGASALAYNDGWLYIAYRTTSEIIRIRLDDEARPIVPIHAEIVARFDPYDVATHTSANLTDMTIDDDGRLYVISAQPARVYRFRPDPANVFDARDDRESPWVDLAARTGRPALKGENLLAHDGWIYVTSGDGYSFQHGATGTIFRIAVNASGH